MEYMVKSPGSCGELIQGRIEGKDFLVTCPINRFSYAVAHSGIPASFADLPLKAREAVAKTCRFIGCENPLQIFLFSELNEGKGMASSSADISAVCMATALVSRRVLTMDELAEIALSIEPSDATFYPGIVQFDYLHGTILKPLGKLPGLHLCIFDEGGMLDTQTFNSRKDLVERRDAHESEIRNAMSLLTEGIKESNPVKIGEATTISAFANQSIIYRKYLEHFHRDVMALGALGLVIAHSGTVCGVLTDSDRTNEMIEMATANYKGLLHYVDSVEIYNEGIHYIEREYNDIRKI